MDEIDFTIEGKRYRLTRDSVIRSMRKQIPGRIQTYAVDVEGVRFPVKQVLAQALQIPVTSFVSTRAQDLLTKLGFDVINLEAADPGNTPADAGGDIRQLALELAVELYARRPSSSVNDVLVAARAMESWLAEPSHSTVHGEHP